MASIDELDTRILESRSEYRRLFVEASADLNADERIGLVNAILKQALSSSLAPINDAESKPEEAWKLRVLASLEREKEIVRQRKP